MLVLRVVVEARLGRVLHVADRALVPLDVVVVRFDVIGKHVTEAIIFVAQGALERTHAKMLHGHVLLQSVLCHKMLKADCALGKFA